MIIKRVIIAQHERALVWKNKTFAGVLEPGKHWLTAPFADVAFQLYDLTAPEFEHPREGRSAIDGTLLRHHRAHR